jgi:type I restriction enzyme S subunit
MKAKDLKNSILQMAVEGKLVPQDPNDEPASVLLERIREEKQRLIAEGKAKFPKGGESIIYTGSDGSPYEKRVDAKGRVLSEKCIADEIPFEKLPEGWAWARLETLALILNGDRGKNYPAKSKLHKSGIPFVSAINIERGGGYREQHALFE